MAVDMIGADRRPNLVGWNESLPFKAIRVISVGMALASSAFW